MTDKDWFLQDENLVYIVLYKGNNYLGFHKDINRCLNSLLNNVIDGKHIIVGISEHEKLIYKLPLKLLGNSL